MKEQELLRVVRQADRKTRISIYSHGMNHQHFGLLVCDIVRNIALAFDVSEDAVWEWVDKERSHPTTDIVTLKQM